jgi:hypothetical protein
MKKTYLLPLAILITTGSLSQTTSSLDVIDYNNVKAFISDGGIYFADPGSESPGYEYPKNSGLNLIYSSSFWYGGTDQNDSLRLAVQQYSTSQDIFPGPYSSSSSYSDQNYLETYSSSMWKINRLDVNQHISNYTQPGYSTPSSIINWPGNGDTLLGVSYQLAPFIDLDQDGKYEPEEGDYPDFKGCEAIYVIVNDDASAHLSTGGNKIGIEMHLLFFQYETDDFLNNTTFVSQKVINRGTHSFTDFSVGMHLDGDLGNPTDDFIGSDSTRNLMYYYNGDANDEPNGSTPGFGVNPPSFGVMLLNKNCTGAGSYTSSGGPATGDPTTSLEYWNIMNGKWGDGSIIYYGGNGRFGAPGVSTNPTRFLYSGNPNNGSSWSEYANGNLPGDRRTLLSVANETLQPGETLLYEYAILTAGGGEWLENVNKLFATADSLLSFYASQDEVCEVQTAQLTETKSIDFKVFPNPTATEFTIQLGELTDEITIIIQDISGREVYSQSFNNASSITIDLRERTGIFFITINNRSGSTTLKLIKD